MTSHTTHYARMMDDNIASAVSQIKAMEITNKNVSKSFRINTMTISIKLGQLHFGQFLDVCMLDNNLSELGLLESEWSLNCSPKFYNCVFLKKSEGVSVKIFRNGNLHLTGEQSVGKAVQHGTELCTVLQPFAKENLEVKEFNIQLINGAFKFAIPQDTVFDLTRMYSLVQESIVKMTPSDLKIDCMFNSDYHSALKIKFTQSNKTTTVSIFKSGSVLIQAFRDGDQLIFIYKYVFSLISNNFDSVTALDPGSQKKRKRNFDYTSYL